MVLCEFHQSMTDSPSLEVGSDTQSMYDHGGLLGFPIQGRITRIRVAVQSDHARATILDHQHEKCPIPYIALYCIE